MNRIRTAICVSFATAATSVAALAQGVIEEADTELLPIDQQQKNADEDLATFEGAMGAWEQMRKPLLEAFERTEDPRFLAAWIYGGLRVLRDRQKIGGAALEKITIIKARRKRLEEHELEVLLERERKYLANLSDELDQLKRRYHRPGMTAEDKLLIELSYGHLSDLRGMAEKSFRALEQNSQESASARRQLEQQEKLIRVQLKNDLRLSERLSQQTEIVKAYRKIDSAKQLTEKMEKMVEALKRPLFSVNQELREQVIKALRRIES